MLMLKICMRTFFVMVYIIFNSYLAFLFFVFIIIVSLFAIYYCCEPTYQPGLREEAQGKLTLAKGDHRPKKMFFLAGKMGIFLTLIAWFFFDVSVSESLAGNYFAAKDPAVYVYAFVAALIVYRWIWGFNVYMWDSVGIDYILLLDLDAKKSNIKPSYDQIFSEATNYSILFFINIIIFHAIKISNETLDENEYSFFAQNAYVLPALLLLGVLGTAISNCRHISYGVFSLDVFAHVSHCLCKCTIVCVVYLSICSD